MKLKTLIQKLITSPVYRFVRAISKAKSILLEASRYGTKRRLILFYPKKASKNQKKIFFGSFRLHYNWCSSHVFPAPRPLRDCDTTFSSVAYHGGGVAVDGDEDPQSSELSGYLEWLEDKDIDDFNVDDGNYDNSGDDNGDGDRDRTDDIDRLADMFIASCHEKFMLEKVESYRRFQEMIARGL